MRVPGLPSLVFLLYVFGVLPWAALRSARLMRANAAGARPLPSRDKIWIGTLVSLASLLFLALVTARTFDYPIFAVPALGPRELGAAALVFALCFALRAARGRALTDAERRTMAVYRIAPRTPSERVLWAATSVMAGVAEEAAYRGVAFAILTYALGSAWVAALLCAAVFALSHAMQGRLSAVMIFVVALLLHALMAFTGTLVLAMLVHATYDLIAGHQVNVRAARFDREAQAIA